MEVIPKIELVPEKKLVGMHMPMSLADHRVVELWRSFMPRRNEIKHAAGNDLFSIDVHNPLLDFKDFTFYTIFEKWAAIEVADFGVIPEGMDPIVIKEGLYAVFHYVGAANASAAMFDYIFNTWLPGSGYESDKRAHFAVMGAKYKGDDPNSEEDIWIPVREKY